MLLNLVSISSAETRSPTKHSPSGLSITSSIPSEQCEVLQRNSASPTYLLVPQNCPQRLVHL